MRLCKKNGKSPFIDWLESVDVKTEARIRGRLNRVEQGNLGEYKLLSKDIGEFKFKYGSGYRIYYGVDKGKIILLLSGGDKGSQKQDIKKAKIYWQEYLEDKDA